MNGRVTTSLLPWSIASLLAGILALSGAQNKAQTEGTALNDGRGGQIAFDSGAALAGGLVDGRPIAPSRVDGDLTLPVQCSPPFRTVVLLHGSLGVSRIQARYRDLLLRECYATFAIDSFTGRGVSSTADDQLAVTTESMVIDAYAALELLQSHPKIDGKKIAVIGWSKGGTAAEHAMWDAVARKFASSGVRFASYVAFYPWCGEQIYTERKMSGPLLFILANEDDWVSGQACAEYAERLRQLQVQVEVKSFDVHHGFDNPEIGSVYFPNAITVGGCNYEPRADGFRDISIDVVRPWTEFDVYFSKCSTIGAHIETDMEAAGSARAALLAFLKRTLGEAQ